MTLEIDFDHPGTCIINEKRGSLILKEPETNSDYASWEFHVDGDDADLPYPNVWTWENPDDPIEDVTLSPSLQYRGGIGPDFHVFIKDGEIKHCRDCQCGC